MSVEFEQELGIQSTDLLKINSVETSVSSLKKRIFDDNFVQLSAREKGEKETVVDSGEFEKIFCRTFNKISPDDTPKSATELSIKKIRAKLH